MKIAVIGGAGFIGNYVVNSLQKSNHEVYPLDSILNISNSMSNWQFDKLIIERTKNFIRPNEKIDIRDFHRTQEFLTEVKPNCIINLAGYSSGKILDEQPSGPSFAAQTMITGLLNLLEIAKLLKISRFVQISSSMVYGDFMIDPAPEEMPCRPKNMYGVFKYSGELIVKDFCTKNQIEYCIVRPTAVYGPMDNNARVLGKFITLSRVNKDLVLNNAKEVLDLTYVEDIADGIAKAAILVSGANETFNMSYGESFRLWDAAEWIKRFSSSNSEIKLSEIDPYYPKRGALDCSKAVRKLDYQSLIDPITGIKRYYDWHKNFFQ